MFEYVTLGGVGRDGYQSPYLHTYAIDFTGYPFQMPVMAWWSPNRQAVRYGRASEAFSVTGRLREVPVREIVRTVSDLILMGEPHYETRKLVIVRLPWLDGRDPETLLPTAWSFLTNPQYPFPRKPDLR